MVRQFKTSHILNADQIKRFWGYVDIKGDDECWLWKLTTNGKAGYGQFGAYAGTGKTSRVNYTTHRLAFMISGGEFTSEKKLVLHSCHNKKCCNPSHLRSGSNKDNYDDALSAKRDAKSRGTLVFARGEKQHKARLTEEKVRYIRKQVSEGTRQIDLAKELNLDATTVWHVVRNHTWKHVA